MFAPTSINPDSLFTGEGLDPFLIPDQITEDTKSMIYKKYNFFYVDTPFLPLCPFTGIVSNSKEISDQKKVNVYAKMAYIRF